MLVLGALECVILLSPFLVAGFTTPDRTATLETEHVDPETNKRILPPVPTTKLAPCPLENSFVGMGLTTPDRGRSHAPGYSRRGPTSLEPEYEDPEATKTPATTEPTTLSPPPPSPPPPPPPPPPCPAESSLHTENDINDMIDYQIIENGVVHILNESFHASFMNVRRTHEQRLNEFLDWFHHRPAHLKHILKALEQTRLRLAPFVKKIQSGLDKYSKLVTSLNSLFDRVTKLHKKLQKYKTLCELSCEDKHTDLILTGHASPPVKYYVCSSIADLFKNVNKYIRNEISSAQTKVKNKQINLNTQLVKDIDFVINKLKGVALKEFGRTMYEILELQDKYFHFEELVKSDLGSTVAEIEENIDLTHLKLKELERNVERVREQCSKCNNKHNAVTSLRFQKLNARQDKYEDIVATLVSLKMKPLVDTFEEGLLESFVSLNTTIYENNMSTDKVIDKLKTIQNEIASMTKAEAKQLENLEANASRASISNLMDLLKKLRRIISCITETSFEAEHLIEYYNN